jgi:PAP2 superfamily
MGAEKALLESKVCCTLHCKVNGVQHDRTLERMAGIHSIYGQVARCGVLNSLLTHSEGVPIGTLKELSGLTDANLARHSPVLEQIVLDAADASAVDSDRKRNQAVGCGVSTFATLLLLLTMLPDRAFAGAGLLGIDHQWAFDNSGIWKRSDQLDLEYGVIATEAVGALWLGNDDPLGHEFWQAIDSTAASSVAAQALKYIFSRARPSQGKGPDKWFQGACCRSFPSGEVTLQAGFVTPIIIDEAARGHPWIWALELLPLYDGIGRLKQQAHWQSDVLAGWALGTASGYWAAHRDTPLSVQILPGGVSVGFLKRF